MESFNLGSDVYLEFTVRVDKRPALITNTTGTLYRNDEYVHFFSTRHLGGRVSGIIESQKFSTIGDFIAKFEVYLDGMGKREHAIPFKIIKSVLGKKRRTKEL